MGRQKYVYNDKTLQFEKHKLSPKQVFNKLLINFGIVLFISGLLIYLGSIFFPTPKERAQKQEIDQLQYHLQMVEKDINFLASSLEDLHEKDNDIHRMIFDMPAFDSSVWESGTGGAETYRYLEGIGVSGVKIKSALSKIDQLKTKFDLQNKSLDTLYNHAIKREDRISSIPSIKPVREDKLKRSIKSLSGYGIRLHPVHKVKKLHQGIDFTAPRGTAIQATGNGKVVKVQKGKRGYGNNVLIDHGFGFKSLYAHMQTIEVKVGQEVKKGQNIGTVGNTGTSTAPHLHYEVWINNKPVNPIDYVLDGLSPTEYKEVVDQAKIENQSWD